MTVTVADEVALPAEFCTASVYVVVAEGNTVTDPLADTFVPLSVTTVAFVVDQVSVLD